MESLLEPTPDLAWVLAAEGFDPLREAIYESRFSISNGLLGLRAGRPVVVGSAGSFRSELTSPVCSTYRVPSTPFLHLFPPRGGNRCALCFPTGRSSTTLPRRFHIARHST
jgi:hypothetical protein